MKAANNIEIQYRAQNIANNILSIYNVPPYIAMAEPNAKIKVVKGICYIDVRMAIPMEDIQNYKYLL